MKDFNSYIKNGGNQGNGQRGTAGSGGKKTAQNGMDVSAILSMLAGKYEGASEEQMISAIIAEAEKGRAAGTLTDADLVQFENTVSPMLNASQRKRLKKIINYLLEK